jgi:hypothetical protein
MNEWYTWVFSGCGVAAFSGLLSYWSTKEKFRRILFLDRNKVDKELGTVSERFDKANESVFISGNDCAFVAVAESPKIEKLLRRNVRVKIMVVDPDSPTPEMLAKIDPRFPTKSVFTESMINTISGLRQLKKKFPDLFEYRLLPILPALGFFITDPHGKEGIVKIEIYTAKEWKPIDSRPHLIIKRKEKLWRNYFLDQWENYWSIAKEESPNKATAADATNRAAE